jgi:hypothetical protein
MKTQSTPKLSLLFPHHNDPAYLKLGDLEELLAPFVATRATSPFRERLQRAIARLSDALVEYGDEHSESQHATLLLRGLRDCRKAANMVHFLFRAGALTRQCRATAFDLLADIAQILIERIHAALGLPPPGQLSRPDVTDDESSKIEDSPTEAEGGAGPPTSDA